MRKCGGKLGKRVKSSETSEALLTLRKRERGKKVGRSENCGSSQYETDGEVGRGKSPAAEACSWFRILDSGSWSKETRIRILDSRLRIEDPAKTVPPISPLPALASLPPSAHLLQAPRGAAGGGGNSAQVNKLMLCGGNLVSILNNVQL